VVSIGVTPYVLFDPTNGLFMKGTHAVDSLWTKPGANFWSRKEVRVHIDLFENGTLKEGDSIEVKNGSVREGEVHLSSFSSMQKSSEVLEEVKTERSVVEGTIENLKEGQNVKLRGTAVQMYSPKFFSVCPECSKKAVQDAEGFSCAEHGKVQPKERALINFVLDDGTETVRVVLFSDQIEKLVPLDALKNTESLAIFREDFLGKELYLTGQVRKNKLFETIELIGNDVEEVEVDKLIAELEA